MNDNQKSKQELIEELDELRSLLYKAEQKHLGLFENVGDSIFIIDTKTLQILDVNSNVIRRFGYTRDELLELTLPDIEVPYADDASQTLEWQSEFSSSRLYESQYLCKDGSLLPIEVSSRLTNLDGQEVFQNFVRDIRFRKLAETNRIEMEKQRVELEIERERAKVLEQFITGASHDLKTPLSVMTTSLYLLQKSTDPERQAHHLNILHEQIGRLGTLLEDMLAMVQLDGINELGLEKVDLNELSKQILENHMHLIKEKHQHLSCDFSPTLAMIDANIFHLSRAIRNVILNAVQYTPDGGNIQIKSYQQGSQIVLEVQDTGVGIAQDDIPHIFERFYRVDKARGTAKGGTGLGLSIAKKIVEMHKGHIEAESVVDQGTTLRIILPKA